MSFRFFSTFVAVLRLAAGFAMVGPVSALEPFDAFLEAHCVSCHGPKKEKGDLRIDQLSRDFKVGADTHHWAEMMEQVNSGEMPPKKEKQPSQAEIAAFVTSLDARIKEGKAARMAGRPAVAHYRLSRKEYQNTVHDLLGVRYDPAKPGELNEDTLWHGFERIGSELSLSPSHVDRYYRAAELVLDRAFPTAASSEARMVRKTAAEIRYGGGKDQQLALDRFDIKRPLRYLLYPGNVQNALSSNWLGKTGPEHSGLYQLRIQASGIRPLGGQTAHLSIGKRTGEETVDGLIEFDITAPEDKPQVYEFEVFLEMPQTLDFCVVATDVVDRRQGAAFRNALGSRGGYIFTHSSETLLLNPNAPQMFDDKGNGLFSTVLLDWIEWEGPLVSEAEKARRKGVVPPDDATPEVVAEHLQRFAERAWRRPVKREELGDYLKSYCAEREAGEKLADAYRVALQGVLTSRHFIYLVEGDTVARERLTDSELASRLSYFLWSSMPDDALFASAKSSMLNGEGLKKAVDRMLSDSKVSRFIDDFSRQWLQLHRVGMFPPDKKLYPAYDAWLEESMRNEPVEFFREMMSFADERKSIWIFDTRTLVHSMATGFPSQNPYTRDELTEVAKARIHRRITWLRSRKYHTLHINTDVLTPEQIWNQAVLDVFLKIEALGYYVSCDWYHDLSIQSHVLFYKALFRLWEQQLGLSRAEKEKIVPGYTVTRLFRYDASDMLEKSKNWWAKKNLALIEAFATRGHHKEEQKMGAMYALMALVQVSRPAAIALPWIVGI